MKKLRVTVEGKVYEVLVEMLDEGPAVVAPMSAPLATNSPSMATGVAAGAADVASPLAGKVVMIDVKIGDSVAQGAQVATIEAMKMNTYTFAPKAGRVVAILVSAGDSVEEGAVLLQDKAAEAGAKPLTILNIKT